MFNLKIFFMVTEKNKTVSFKDVFKLETVSGPRIFHAPSCIEAKQRNVKVVRRPNGYTYVHWSYEEKGYSEDYTLRLRAKDGDIVEPTPDGSGITINGHQVGISFYKLAQ